MCTGNLEELLLLNQNISEVVFAFFYLQQIHGKTYTVFGAFEELNF
jgi:hypothetical protein